MLALSLLTLLTGCYDTLILDADLDLKAKVAHVTYQELNFYQDDDACTDAPTCVEVIRKEVTDAQTRLTGEGGSNVSGGARMHEGILDLAFTYDLAITAKDPENAGFVLFRKLTPADVKKGRAGKEVVGMVTSDEPNRSETTTVTGAYDVLTVPGEKPKRIWTFRGAKAHVHVEHRSLDSDGKETHAAMWAGKIDGFEAALGAAGLLLTP